MLHKISGLFLALLPVLLFGQSSFFLPSAVNIIESPKGTGNVSGIIATIKLQNTSSDTVNFDTPFLYIPSSGKYQAYLIPPTSHISLPPGKKIKISFQGYCLDIQKPAAPKNKKLPPVEEWIAIGNALTVSINKYMVDPKYLTLPRVVTNIPEKINTEKETVLIPRERLEEALPMISDAYEKLENTIHLFQKNNQTFTVFATSPEKEKLTLMQHSIWLYTAALTGSTYEYEYFEKKLILEIENETSVSFNKMSITFQKDILDQSRNFWKTFLAISDAAGIIKSSVKE